jgi:hypothetical protein
MERTRIIICAILFIPFYLLHPQETEENHTRTIEHWITDGFEAEENTIVGIWSKDLRLKSAEELIKLKNQYGFNYIYVNIHIDSATVNLLLNSGYSRDRMMVQIIPENYQEKIKEFGTVFAYYIDEPNERGFSISGVKEFIDMHAPGSLYIISGYRRTSGLNSFVKESDGVMFSSYKHWWNCFPGVWCPWPENTDQREDWTDMLERYGEKSFMNWVGAHRDVEDYPELLLHAADLKLPGVWLYQYQDELNSDENLLKFSEAAWAAGYLKKYMRKFIYEYRCTHPGGSECSDNSTAGYALYMVHPTDEIRIVPGSIRNLSHD